MSLSQALNQFAQNLGRYRRTRIRCLLLLMTTTKCWGVKLPYVYWMRLRGILTMVWSVCR